MTAAPAWWRTAAGMPPTLASAEATRSTIAAGLLVTFVLATSGVFATVRHDDDQQGLRRSCVAARTRPSAEPAEVCR